APYPLSLTPLFRSRASSALQRPVIGDLGGGRRLVDSCRAELAPLPCRKPSPAVAGRPLRVSKGGGGGRRPTPGDRERKGLPAAAGPVRSAQSQTKQPQQRQTSPPRQQELKVGQIRRRRDLDVVLPPLDQQRPRTLALHRHRLVGHRNPGI